MQSTLGSRVLERCHAHHVAIAEDQATLLSTYLDLLTRWNRAINLTALPLEPEIPAASIDKLIVEPLVSARLIAPDFAEWLDLGSGGGSPAVPLRVMFSSGHLLMVESRARKCSFLREVVRTLGFPHTQVHHGRFEELDAAADLITIRAVRLDQEFIAVASRLLRPGGALVVFGGQVADPRFASNAQAILPDGSMATRYVRCST